MWLKQEEVIEKLIQEHGIRMVARNLWNWETWGLIREADRSHKRRPLYAPETVGEAYAAWCLLHGQYGEISGIAPCVSPGAIALIRKGFTGSPLISAFIDIYKKLIEKGAKTK